MNQYSEKITIFTEVNEKYLYFDNSNLETKNEISLNDSFNSDFSYEENKYYSKDLIENQFQDISSKELNLLGTIEVAKLHYMGVQNQEIKEKTIEKKRGRGKINELKGKIHDRCAPDNLLRKIQVHYLSFIIAFLNVILNSLNYKEQLFKLDYKYKKNINKQFVESLKSKTIGEIVCNKISVQYKKHDKNSNKNLYSILEKDEVLNKILSENYLTLFKKVYFKSNIIINLKEYGLNKDIILPKEVKMFKDLLKCNESSDENDNYKKNMKECAINNYMPDSIFTFY